MTEEEAAELRDRVSLELDRLMTGNYKVVDTFTEFVKNECDESFRAGRQDAVIEQTAIWEARMAEAAIENRQLGRVEGHQSAALYHPRLVSKDEIAGAGASPPPEIDTEVEAEYEIRSAARREAFEALRNIIATGTADERIAACKVALETNQW